jgi:predicted PurR-regulated permease PerM
MNTSRVTSIPRAGVTSGLLPGVVAFGLALALCWAAKVVLITLLVSMLIAFMLEPLAAALERVKVPSPLASLAAVLLLAGALWGATAVVYDKAADFARNLPAYSTRVRAMTRHVRDRTQRLEQAVRLDAGAAENAPAAAEPALLTRSIGPVSEFLLTASFVPFLVYFMLSWRRHVHRALVLLFPADGRRAAHETLGAIAAMMRAFIVGNVVIGALLGVASTVVFAAVGVPDVLFVGPLSGFLSVVPYLGVLLAMTPPLLADAPHLTAGKAVTIVGTVLALHVIALNVLYPKLIGSRLSLNPLAVTVALLFWGWLWGGFGLLLAVPITAAIKSVCDHVEGWRGWGTLLGDDGGRGGDDS